MNDHIFEVATDLRDHWKANVDSKYMFDVAYKANKLSLAFELSELTTRGFTEEQLGYAMDIAEVSIDPATFEFAGKLMNYAEEEAPNIWFILDNAIKMNLLREAVVMVGMCLEYHDDVQLYNAVAIANILIDRVRS